MSEEKLDLVKVENLTRLDTNEYPSLILLETMHEVGLITKQGIRIQGMGLVLKKLDEIWKKVDQIKLELWKMNKDKQKEQR